MAVPDSVQHGGKIMQYAVGVRLERRSSHVLVDAEDAFQAALKVKQGTPMAFITYVRPQNRRGDARHPASVSQLY